MSLKIPEASLTPQTVYTGAQFIISVLVHDDIFEFSATLVEDKYQGFADIEQTIGGMFINDSVTMGISDSDGKRLVDSNDEYIIPSNEADYKSNYTGQQIDNFISGVLENS